MRLKTIIKLKIKESYLTEILNGKKSVEYRQIGKKSFIILENHTRTVKARIEKISILPSIFRIVMKKMFPDIKWKNEKIIKIYIKNPRVVF